MGKLYIIIGPSNSGKDTIYKEILNRTNIKPITLYTTRPIRDNEINHVTYNFVTKKELDELDFEGKVIELRKYDTVSGPWYYATVDNDIDLDNYDYLTINTLEGYKKLKNYYKEKVEPIYIKVDYNERLNRAIRREKQQQNPNYKELKRRFIADSYDFAKEKLLDAGITNYYENNNLEECIELIINKINEKTYKSL